MPQNYGQIPGTLFTPLCFDSTYEEPIDFMDTRIQGSMIDELWQSELGEQFYPPQHSSKHRQVTNKDRLQYFFGHEKVVQ